jgi:DNA-binding transcriptional MerR regulator
VHTVKQLSELAGVTIRTLHHYDQIGLLRPTSVGGNGYRYYGDEALYRLQQIFFYRELDLPLSEIKKFMGRPDFDVLTGLEAHRSALRAEARRLNRLMQTIDKTISQLKGEGTMDPKGLFEGFSAEVQEKYAEEAAQKWDPETVRASNLKWKSYSPAEKHRILAEGQAVNADLAAVMAKSAASKQAQAVIARWHAQLQDFWSPNDEQLLGLAELYMEDPRFTAGYEKVAPGLATFMVDAVREYVKNREK